MNNLYTYYENLDNSRWNYYNNSPKLIGMKKSIRELFSNECSKDFIELYYKSGMKGEALNIAFKDESYG